MRYRVTVVTGDVKGAETSANVWIRIKGDTAESSELPLSRGLRNKRLFDRAAIDDFDFVLEDVGMLQQIIVWHDGAEVWDAMALI